MRNCQLKCKSFKDALFKLSFFLGIFVFAVLVWYSPVLFKGYSAQTIGNNALLGRNIAATNLYSMESDLNVILPPEMLKEQGHASAFGNKLTSYAYGKIFQITGIPDVNNIVLASIFLYALSLLIFAITVYYLFNFKIAAAFAVIYVFLPFNWYAPYHLGTNEFALLFISLFFLFFFLGEKQEKYQGNYYIISGVFLAMAGMAKEAFFLTAPFVLLYMWLKNRRYLFYLFLSFFALLLVFWLPGIKNDAYMQFFSSSAPESVQNADFAYYSHAYPDPYTFYYDKEAFLQEYTNISSLVFAQKLERLKVMQNMGIDSISLFARLASGMMISVRHLSRFISFEDMGGPFIFLLFLLGLYILKKQDKNIFWFFSYWIIAVIFLLSFVSMGSRTHFIDFNWAVALLIALGAIETSKIFACYFNISNKKNAIILAVFVILIAYNLLSANHAAWSRIYDGSSNLKKQAFSEKIDKMEIANSDVIAVSFGTDDICYMSYLNSKSYVAFREETIEKLIAKGELQSAFDIFGVKYILGYSDIATEKIIAATNAVNIASDSLEPAAPELSRNKSWLMNVIK